MKRGCAKNKKGQIKLSFGMIFSIILIIVFLAFAFFAIRTFLGIQDTASKGKFVTDLRGDIDRIWGSSQSSETEAYSLPSGTDSVCFVDFNVSAGGENSALYNELKTAYFGSENLVFYPVDFSEAGSVKINNIDLGAMTSSENPFCIQKSNGKVSMRFVKNFDDALVTITRADE